MKGHIQGPTMNDIRDPAIKRNQLIKRRDHINEQINELRDRQYLIQCEIDVIR
jgi:hypothetical protein